LIRDTPVKKAIESGEIGNLEQLTTPAVTHPPPLEYIPKSGGLFRDMMIHDFDMARWMLGEEPTNIHSRGSSLVDPEIGKLGDIDTACVTLVTPSGKQAVILNSRRTAYGFDQRIEAFGSTGMVMSDNPKATGLSDFQAQALERRIAFAPSSWNATATVIAWKLRRLSMDWLKANRHQ
jgi:myo-inositol 2-dehydrogenase/D-chiro-inositol 1-dehydrogenase